MTDKLTRRDQCCNTEKRGDQNTGWRGERRRRLLEICLELAAARANGVGLYRTARAIARRNRKAKYRSKRAHFPSSLRSIMRHYYAWSKRGEDCVQDRRGFYGRPVVDASTAAKFNAALLEASDFRSACQQFPNLQPQALRRQLTTRQHEKVRALHAARRRLQLAHQSARRALQ